MISSIDIYIIELTAGGHRTTFLKYLIDYAKSLKLTPCIVTLTKTANSFDHFSVPIATIDIDERYLKYTQFLGNKLSYQIATYQSINKFLKTVTPRKGVIFPTLQSAGGIPLGIAGKGYPWAWSGVVMAPAAHLREYSIESLHSSLEITLQKIAYKRMIKHSNCLRISSFDYLFVEWIKNTKVVQSPDPVEVFSRYDTVGKDLLRIKQEKKPIIGVIGTIDKRKNIGILASVINAMQGCPFHLLIAGNVKDSDEISSSAIRHLVANNLATIISRRLSDEELDFSFYHSDVIWSGNLRTYGSSGAVVRGSAHSKPVITMAGSVMGNVLAKNNGGPVINMGSESSIHDTLSELLNGASRQRLGMANSRVFPNNDWQEYAKTVFEPFIN